MEQKKIQKTIAEMLGEADQFREQMLKENPPTRAPKGKIRLYLVYISNDSERDRKVITFGTSNANAEEKVWKSIREEQELHREASIFTGQITLKVYESSDDVIALDED